jgi:diguanylate cyclase (GGDEF)-like protein
MKLLIRSPELNFPQQWVILVCALFTLAGFVAFTQYRDHQRVGALERERLTKQTEIIEKNVIPQLLLANRVIDSIIKDLPSWTAARDGYKRANHQLQVINDSLNGIRPLLVIGPDGTVVASSNETLVGMNFVKREYFQTALQNPDPRILHVSAPFKTVLDTFVISLFRTIPGPNGKFGGIVIVSAIPEYFSILIDSVRYAPEIRTSIAHEDGKVFLTSPKSVDIEGKDLNQPGTLFRQHRDSGRLENVFDGTVYASGDQRILALRTIQLTDPPMDKALIVGVGREAGAVYAPWRRNLHAQGILLTLIVVSSTLVLCLVQRRQHMQATERRLAEVKITQLEFHDPLTGLPNRSLLMDRFRQDMAASARDESYCALMFVDLDNFKTLNDTVGHGIGDLLLQEVAQRLSGCVREGDTVARLGGDDFVVLVSTLGKTQADAAKGTEVAAENILAAIGKPYRLKELIYHTTASIGVTLFRGHDTTIEELMKQADLAMYRSKEAGRNGWHFFDPKMESVVKIRAELEEDLRQALQEGQFLLYYQAQVVGEGRVTGAEVLVRWQHPLRGLVSPADFIQLAEETGLILPLGHYVLEAACKQLALWAKQVEFEHLTVAVNVSAKQFRQADFANEVVEVLRQTGADPRRLKLELTESLLVDNVQDIIEKMFALKAKGVAFSLDDFGTGYSSLAYLKRLPLDQLKIDQGFVRDVLSDPNDAAIAKTIVALGQNLGLSVIAEGVETKAQLDFLESAGCHAFQGYYFSRPVPFEDYEMYLKKC